MNRKLFILFNLLIFSGASLSKEPCTLNGWNKREIEVEINDENEANGSRSETIFLYAYRRWPSYLPGYYLGPQVVILNGAKGEVECASNVTYNNIGMKASYNGRQAITLNINYWDNGRNTVELAAAYVVEVLNQLVDSGYLRSSFYVLGGSAGTAIISAALDYHPTFVNRVDRAIFVSGPFNGIGAYYIQNNTIRKIVDTYHIHNFISLDAGIAYNSTRFNQWIKPIMEKKGLRFYVAEDDNVFCRDNHEYPFTNSECQLGTMDVELLNWLDDATDGTGDRASLENLGVLWIYQQGGHNLFKTHPELLNSALVP